MKDQLERIAKSYDTSIELGMRGIDLYKQLPDYIRMDKDYPIFEKARTEGLDSDSGCDEIREYLLPEKNMEFIDLGCCLNLMFNGYDKWPSTYHGVDISSETIQLLKDFVAKNNISIGSLHCVSMHKLPFEDNYFDMAACIGVLEYFEKDYIEEAIIEIHRILKPNAKFVLDIPDIDNPMRRLMMLIEEYMGRPDLFDLQPSVFDQILQDYFTIERVEKLEAVAMIRYYLKNKGR